MKAKLILAILLAAAAVIFVPGCKRGDIDEPGPTGPSSFAIILKATASTNTLLAADSRGITTISASLKKYDGTSIANKTVYFEIVDAYGTKITKGAGYFDGNTTVKVGSTDGSGNVSTAYYGPTGPELEYLVDKDVDGVVDYDYVNQAVENVLYYIRVSAATDGARFVSEMVPLYVICADMFYTFELRAYPATLYATSDRQRAEIVATVKKGGKPLAGKKIWFEILSPVMGYFDDGKMGIQVQTVLDGAGQARVGYFGPLGAEISDDVHVMLSARAETDTRFPPEGDPPTEGRLQVKFYLYIHVTKQK